MVETGSNRTKRKAPQPPFARLAVSDELGLIKVLDVPAGPSWDATGVVHVWGEPDKSRSISAFAAPNYLKPQGAEVLAVGRAAGVVQILDAKQGQTVATFQPAASKATKQTADSNKSNSTVHCLAFRQSPDHHLGLVSCSASGLLQVINSGNSESVDEEDAAGQQGWNLASSFQTAQNVLCMALDPSQQHVAVGGDGCNVQVWDLASSSEVLRAKGGRPNKVGNVDLPHITALTYLPDPSGQLILAGTVKHKLWMYDMRVGKRPQVEVAWGETRITALEPLQDGSKVWVANGTGNIEALDMKKRVMQGSCKGAAGSIRALSLHPDAEEPWLACAGLDRFARVYSAETRRSQCKVYCKQQLTGVAWLAPPAEGRPVEGEDGDGEGQGQAEPSGSQQHGGDTNSEAKAHSNVGSAKDKKKKKRRE